MDASSLKMDDVNVTFATILRNRSDMQNDDFLEKYNNEIFVTMLPAIIYTIVMIILGLPGNIIVFYIYLCKWQRSTSRIFILFLAALDTLNCSTNLPMEIFIMWNSLRLDQPVLCKIFRYSSYVMNCSSALILVGIAVDRFKRICKPYQRNFTETQSMCISIAALAWSLATTWPSLILYGTRTINIGINGSACLLENRHDTSPYPLIYFSFMITTTMITFVVLIILYFLIGIQIYKRRNFKLKNCRHVQKFLDDKSTPVKLEKSKDKNMKLSDNEQIDNQEDESNINHKTILNVVEEESLLQNKNLGIDLKAIQTELPSPSKDIAASHDLLDNSHQRPESVEHFSHIDISRVPRDTFENSYNDLEINEESVRKNQSPQRHTQMDKDKEIETQVNYIFAKYSSTLNAPRQFSCANCSKVRVGRSTFMLFLITIAYVLSFLPFYILVVVRQYDNDFVQRMSKSGLAFYHLFLRSYLLSSAVNPFIYSFCNVQFRDFCKEMFLRFRHRK